MKPDVTIALEAPPEKQTIADLGAGLRDYNEHFTGPTTTVEYVVTLRDPSGKFLGGIYCDLYWGALFIKWVWLDGSMRKHKFGANMMAEAEAEGRRRGATMAHLDTF